MSLIYTEAFAKYGATLNSQQWSVSAFGSDGCLYIKLVVAHPISAGDAALVGNVAEVGPPRASAQGPLNLRANARDHFPKKERT